LGEAWKIFSARQPAATLVLAGDGPEKPAFERFVKENSLHGSVRLEGLKENITDYYRAADFFVLSSDNEGMSNALLEAMLCGLPPLVKDIAGCVMVKNGENGLKAPSGSSAQQFAALLERALAMPPEEKAALGQAAEREIRTGYTLASVADKYLKIYSEKRP
ncbi:MAG TPA: glycosyltransferase, partial [Elusimicrobiales bacterium]|nr:glycosyltransferase [Elusimicrobiales bacterium]